MNYLVLYAPDVAHLVVEVRKALRDGWKLAGGVAVIADRKSPTGHMLLQAITK
jgi:hypothetical protein